MGRTRSPKEIEKALIELSVMLDQDADEEGDESLEESYKVIMAEGLALLVFLARRCLRLLAILCGFLLGLLLAALL